jgi:hypothetical protein
MMPINFTELVERVEAKNRQNRAELTSQVMPFLEVAVKKSLYEQEKRRAADESVTAFTELGKATGFDFVPMTGAGGEALDPKYQQMAYSAQAESQAPIKQMEAFASVFGTDLPENYNNLKPQEATLVLEKMKQDYATEQTIADMLTMYPDIAEKVSGDPRYQGGNLKVKAALVRKALADKEAQEEFDRKIQEEIAKSNIRLGEYQAKSNIDIKEAQTKANIGGGSGSASTAGERKAANIIKQYEGAGKVYGGSTVTIKKEADGIAAYSNIQGYEIRKKGGVYEFKSRDKWRPLKIDKKKPANLIMTKGRNKTLYNAKNILDGALTEYSNSLSTVGGNRKQQAKPPANKAKTYNEFDDIFK